MITHVRLIFDIDSLGVAEIEICTFFLNQITMYNTYNQNRTCSYISVCMQTNVLNCLIINRWILYNQVGAYILKCT